MKKNSWGWLMPHEYVHSWNGKFRRPADMVTATFQEPQRTKYLWVYEGLTQYLGMVLTARSGLWTDEQFRDNLAQVGDWAKNQRGRTWRPLQDTTVAAQLLYSARSDWAAWRRGVDFYDEGLLIWLEVDTLIRDQTKGAKSLDDFCRRFFGGKEGDYQVKPYHFDELVADLNAVSPHDWKDLLHRRLTSTKGEPPLEGIRRGGWKLVYTEKTNEMIKENDSENKTIDLTSSLGLMLKEEGNVTDVVPGKPAYKAGIGPGMKILAINGRRWTDKGFHSALVASKKNGKIDVIVENGENIQMLTMPYQDGERFPHLEQEKGAPDWLGDILKPLGPVEKGEKEEE
jgi:predicted metalloprotease with PDZ domain